MKTLREMGEDGLIARLLELVPCAAGAEGPGDDCAVLDVGGERLLLLKTDALVEGVHYEKGMDGRRVGWKAMARVFSDFAAMGGRGDRFLLTLALPGDLAVGWVEDFYRGAGDALERFGAVLVGGETCRVPDGSAAVVSVSAMGSVERERVVLRSGGKVGDEIWVTGRLGGSLGGKHLDFVPRLAEAAWLAEVMSPGAMMDVSDGVAKDLPRLAAASGCGFEIFSEKIPRSAGCSLEQALGDGEDFELLFALRAGAGVEELWGQVFPGTELSRIGRLVAVGEGVELEGGWDHFQGEDGWG